MVYNWIWLIIGVIVAGVLYLVFSPIIGGIVDQTNEMTTDGTISSQTSNTVSFTKGLYLLSPAIALIGFILAVYIRGVNEKRRSGGY